MTAAFGDAVMALPPVIPLHAFPVDARLWEDVEQQLHEQGIELIVPNLRGFGTNRDELPTEPNLDALADDVAARSRDRRTVSGCRGRLYGWLRGDEFGTPIPRTRRRASSSLIPRLQRIRRLGRMGARAFADRVDAEGSAW